MRPAVCLAARPGPSPRPSPRRGEGAGCGSWAGLAQFRPRIEVVGGADALAAGALHGGDPQRACAAGDVDAFATGTEHAARCRIVRQVKRAGAPDAQRLASDLGIAAGPRVEGTHLA